MPYKSSGLKLSDTQKRSRKLSDKDRLEIQESYAKGNISQRALAVAYGVSRRTIVFTIYPERRKQNYQRRVERGGSKQYYDKDKHTKAIRETRKYKQELYLNGELN